MDVTPSISQAKYVGVAGYGRVATRLAHTPSNVGYGLTTPIRRRFLFLGSLSALHHYHHVADTNDGLNIRACSLQYLFHGIVKKNLWSVTKNVKCHHCV